MNQIKHVRNKTIIGLKFILTPQILDSEKLVRNKTIIGLKLV